jgi:hypothetical protein
MRNRSACESDDSIWLAFIGAYETEAEAHEAMKDDLENLRARWADEDGEDAAEAYTAEIDERNAGLLDGDLWDHDYWVRWAIFDTDEPGTAYCY